MPPKETDDIEDMDAESSTAPELDENAETTEVEATPAESSTATTDETEPDTLSVVRDVVDARASEEAEAAPSAEGEEGTGAEETPAGGEDNENFSDVPFHQHPRFKQLVNERNALRPAAANYRNVENFLGQVNISPAEAADAMEIAGLMKTDPQEAWKRLQPGLQTLLIAAGEVLTPDLEQMVESKAMTREAALEVSRSRAAVSASTKKTQFEQERGQRQQQTQQGQAIHDAAKTWEAGRMLKDPNFAAKAPLIRKKIEFLHSTGQVPTTAEGVTEQLRLVYGAVNRELGVAAAAQTRQQQQKKPALRPITGGQVAGNAANASAPKSTMDVIRQVRASRSA